MYKIVYQIWFVLKPNCWRYQLAVRHQTNKQDMTSLISTFMITRLHWQFKVGSRLKALSSHPNVIFFFLWNLYASVSPHHHPAFPSSPSRLCLLIEYSISAWSGYFSLSIMGCKEFIFHCHLIPDIQIYHKQLC